MIPTDKEINDWHTERADLTRLGSAEDYWSFEVSTDDVIQIVHAALARWGSSTTPALEPMTNQHRATPEQWNDLGAFAADTRACVLELRARVEALEAAQRPSPAPAPADSLVERVTNVLGHYEDGTARAAIREVAAWLRSEYPKREGYGTAWATLLDDEANR